MRKVIVFGSGGMAKELIQYLESDGIEILYVVSTEPFNNPAYGYQVRPDIDPAGESADWILGVAMPDVKRAIVSAHPGGRWTSYAHSSAIVSSWATIGRGCVFAPQAIVVGDPVIGEFCFFNTNATIGHDSRLGAYSTLFPNTEVCGDCSLGENCILGIGAYVVPGCRLPSGSKISAGAIVRESYDVPCTVYGDSRGQHRVKQHADAA